MTVKDLDVWSESVDLVTTLYRITTRFPDHEKFGLISQIRRAAVSVPANLSEGSGRKYPKEFLRFLHISMGSLLEIETLLIISLKLEFIDSLTFNGINRQIHLISAQLAGLIRSIEKKIQ